MGLPALNVTAEGSLAFGLVLSGMLIGGADYFDSVATIFDEASADPKRVPGRRLPPYRHLL
jgi:hypothetical protein